jgi:hypothetical protein
MTEEELRQIYNQMADSELDKTSAVIQELLAQRQTAQPGQQPPPAAPPPQAPPA